MRLVRAGIVAGIALPLLAIAAIVAWHWPSGQRLRVDLAHSPATDACDAGAETAPLRFVVGSMVSPRATYDRYRDLLDVLGDRLGRPVEMILRKSYREANEMLRSGDADAGWICTGAYAALPEGAASPVLAVPVSGGRPEYRSVTVVRSDSGIRTLEEMAGRSFAYVDPLSLTGRAWVVSRFARQGVSDSAFFRTVAWSGSHDRSLEMVADGTVDGACVDSLIFDALARTSPERTGALRVIDRSPPFPAPPLVASPLLAAPEAARLASALAALHLDPRGAAILADIGLERLDPPGAGVFDEVRRLVREAGPGGAP